MLQLCIFLVFGFTAAVSGTEQRFSKSLKIDDAITLKCYPDKENKPSEQQQQTIGILWQYNGVEISYKTDLYSDVLDKEKITGAVRIVDNGGLEIEITAVNDKVNGTFACKIMGKPGIRRSRFYDISVYDPLAFMSNAPSDQVEVELGRRALINCTAKGLPKPTVLWSVEGGRGTAPQQQVQSGSFLQIVRTDKTTIGPYRCTANNSRQTISKIVKLQLLYPPKVIEETGQTQLQQRDRIRRRHVSIGDQVKLACKGEGGPRPDAVWSRGRTKLLATEKSITAVYLDDYTTESTLNVKVLNRSMLATYKCTMSNSRGSDWIRIELTDTPSDLIEASAECFSTECIVKWNNADPDSTATVDYFSVVATEVGTNERVMTNWTRRSPAVIRDLKRKTEYVFQVMPINEYGQGRSVQTKAVTLAGDKTIAPELMKNLWTTTMANDKGRRDADGEGYDLQVGNGQPVAHFISDVLPVPRLLSALRSHLPFV